ncbi:SAM-dependent methyltransferase [Lacipirellula limnantheis]|uniref:Putative 23S rRNA ribose 2'-O-ribose methyltransferase n=1 Tax=Lacipirellula limnantheis TaxID=2528024 RepID=A0A517TXH6_9BACT|nr:SAM-dependent methyltransferase [Lacipirellula limnantheis]QDT73085.1 putative 23S rRNA ribose 2'-O-ribose methyltransferase [Lacipirellula limnantheis]
MPTPWRPPFVYAVCQHGAEAVLKRELAVRAPQLRPAFSRPGFVTFKLDAPCADPEKFSLPSVFARTSGFSLGSVKGQRLHDLAAEVWQLPEVQTFLASVELAGLHVWQRDERTPGDRGFEPGPTLLAAEAEQVIRELSPIESLRPAAAAGRSTPRNRWVLDVALIEPNHWFVGCHRTTSRVASWPGGVPDLELPEHAVSRAYLKMAEAMSWASLPMSRGERVVELGCAPGGASQALLDAGLEVIGVDPAEVDESVLADPRFTHVRSRSVETSRKVFRHVQWLAADMNVPPNFTLDAVEAVVKHPGISIRGMLLTLKLPDLALVDELPKFVERVRSWGYLDVRLRQLAFNRQELCLAALRSRSQRRVLRDAGARRRSTNKPALTPSAAPLSAAPAPADQPESPT